MQKSMYRNKTDFMNIDYCTIDTLMSSVLYMAQCMYGLSYTLLMFKLIFWAGLYEVLFFKPTGSLIYIAFSSNC